ncbi:unnamed protein product [Amoebophrya sp. A120]|nr:unnamed protein product [Amoebophrya sp. A120]|eukprot:GSA120T00019650001.1
MTASVPMPAAAMMSSVTKGEERQSTSGAGNISASMSPAQIQSTTNPSNKISPWLYWLLSGVQKMADFALYGWSQATIDVECLKSSGVFSSEQKMLELFGFTFDCSKFPRVFVSKTQPNTSKGADTRATQYGVQVGDQLLMINGQRVTMVASWQGRHFHDAIMANILQRVTAQKPQVAHWLFLTGVGRKQYLQMQITHKDEVQLDVKKTDSGRIVKDSHFGARILRKDDEIVAAGDFFCGESDKEGLAKLENLMLSSNNGGEGQYVLVRRKAGFEEEALANELKLDRPLPDGWLATGNVPMPPPGSTNTAVVLASSSPTGGAQQLQDISQLGKSQASAIAGAAKIPPWLYWLLSGVKDMAGFELYGWSQATIDVECLKSSGVYSSENKMLELFGFTFDCSRFPRVFVSKTQAKTAKGSDTRATQYGVHVGDQLLMINGQRVTMVATWQGRHFHDAVMSNILERVMAKKPQVAHWLFLNSSGRKQYLQMMITHKSELQLDVKKSKCKVTADSHFGARILKKDDEIVAAADFVCGENDKEGLAKLEKLVANNGAEGQYVLVRRKAGFEEQTLKAELKLDRPLPDGWLLGNVPLPPDWEKQGGSSKQGGGLTSSTSNIITSAAAQQEQKQPQQSGGSTLTASASTSSTTPPPWLYWLLSGAKDMTNFELYGWSQASIDVETLKSSGVYSSEAKMLELFGFTFDISKFPKVFVSKTQAKTSKGTDTRATQYGVHVGDQLLMLNGQRVTMVATWRGRHFHDCLMANVLERVEAKKPQVAHWLFLNKNGQKQYLQMQITHKDEVQLELGSGGSSSKSTNSLKSTKIQRDSHFGARILKKDDEIVAAGDFYCGENNKEGLQKLEKLLLQGGSSTSSGGSGGVGTYILVRRKKGFEKEVLNSEVKLDRPVPEGWLASNVVVPSTSSTPAAAAAAASAKVVNAGAATATAQAPPTGGSSSPTAGGAAASTSTSPAPTGKVLYTPDQGPKVTLVAPTNALPPGAKKSGKAAPFLFALLMNSMSLTKAGLVYWEQTTIDKEVLFNGAQNGLTPKERMAKLFGMELDWTLFPLVKVTKVIGSKQNPTRAFNCGVEVNDYLVIVHYQRMTMVMQWKGVDPNDAILNVIGKEYQAAESGGKLGEKKIAAFIFLKQAAYKEYLQVSGIEDLDLGITMHATNGEIVEAVKPNSWAGKIGLQKGDEVTVLNDKVIPGKQKYYQLVAEQLSEKGSRPIDLLFRRKGGFPEKVKKENDDDLSRPLPDKWKQALMMGKSGSAKQLFLPDKNAKSFSIARKKERIETGEIALDSYVEGSEAGSQLKIHVGDASLLKKAPAAPSVVAAGAATGKFPSAVTKAAWKKSLNRSSLEEDDDEEESSEEESSEEEEDAEEENGAENASQAAAAAAASGTSSSSKKVKGKAAAITISPPTTTVAAAPVVLEPAKDQAKMKPVVPTAAPVIQIMPSGLTKKKQSSSGPTVQVMAPAAPPGAASVQHQTGTAAGAAPSENKPDYPPFLPALLMSCSDVGSMGVKGWFHSRVNVDILRDTKMSSEEKFLRLFGFVLDWTRFPFVYVSRVEPMTPSNRNKSSANKHCVLENGDLLIMVNEEKVTTVPEWLKLHDQTDKKTTDPHHAILNNIDRKLKDLEKQGMKGMAHSAAFGFLNKIYIPAYLQVTAGEDFRNQQLGVTAMRDNSMQTRTVTGVAPGSWFEKQGLTVGDIIVAVNNELVQNNKPLVDTTLSAAGARPAHFLIFRRDSAPFSEQHRAKVQTDLTRQLPDPWGVFLQDKAKNASTYNPQSIDYKPLPPPPPSKDNPTGKAPKNSAEGFAYDWQKRYDTIGSQIGKEKVAELDNEGNKMVITKFGSVTQADAKQPLAKNNMLVPKQNSKFMQLPTKRKFDAVATKSVSEEKMKKYKDFFAENALVKLQRKIRKLLRKKDDDEIEKHILYLQRWDESLTVEAAREVAEATKQYRSAIASSAFSSAKKMGVAEEREKKRTALAKRQAASGKGPAAALSSKPLTQDEIKRLGISKRLSGRQLLASKRFRNAMDAETKIFVMNTETMLEKAKAVADNVIKDKQNKNLNLQSNLPLQRQHLAKLHEQMDLLEMQKPLTVVAVSKQSRNLLPPHLEAARTKAMKYLRSAVLSALVVLKNLYRFLAGPNSLFVPRTTHAGVKSLVLQILVSKRNGEKIESETFAECDYRLEMLQKTVTDLSDLFTSPMAQSEIKSDRDVISNRLNMSAFHDTSITWLFREAGDEILRTKQKLLVLRSKLDDSPAGRNKAKRFGTVVPGEIADSLGEMLLSRKMKLKDVRQFFEEYGRDVKVKAERRQLRAEEARNTEPIYDSLQEGYDDFSSDDPDSDQEGMGAKDQPVTMDDIRKQIELEDSPDRDAQVLGKIIGNAAWWQSFGTANPNERTLNRSRIGGKTPDNFGLYATPNEPKYQTEIKLSDLETVAYQRSRLKKQTRPGNRTGFLKEQMDLAKPPVVIGGAGAAGLSKSVQYLFYEDEEEEVDDGRPAGLSLSQPGEQQDKSSPRVFEQEEEVDDTASKIQSEEGSSDATEPVPDMFDVLAEDEEAAPPAFEEVDEQQREQLQQQEHLRRDYNWDKINFDHDEDSSEGESSSDTSPMKWKLGESLEGSFDDVAEEDDQDQAGWSQAHSSSSLEDDSENFRKHLNEDAAFEREVLAASRPPRVEFGRASTYVQEEDAALLEEQEQHHFQEQMQNSIILQDEFEYPRRRYGPPAPRRTDDHLRHLPGRASITETKFFFEGSHEAPAVEDDPLSSDGDNDDNFSTSQLSEAFCSDADLSDEDEEDDELLSASLSIGSRAAARPGGRLGNADRNPTATRNIMRSVSNSTSNYSSLSRPPTKKTRNKLLPIPSVLAIQHGNFGDSASSSPSSSSSVGSCQRRVAGGKCGYDEEDVGTRSLAAGSSDGDSNSYFGRSPVSSTPASSSSLRNKKRKIRADFLNSDLEDEPGEQDAGARSSPDVRYYRADSMSPPIGSRRARNVDSDCSSKQHDEGELLQPKTEERHLSAPLQPPFMEGTHERSNVSSKQSQTSSRTITTRINTGTALHVHQRDPQQLHREQRPVLTGSSASSSSSSSNRGTTRPGSSMSSWQRERRRGEELYNHSLAVGGRSATRTQELYSQQVDVKNSVPTASSSSTASASASASGSQRRVGWSVLSSGHLHLPQHHGGRGSAMGTDHPRHRSPLPAPHSATAASSRSAASRRTTKKHQDKVFLFASDAVHKHEEEWEDSSDDDDDGALDFHAPAAKLLDEHHAAATKAGSSTVGGVVPSTLVPQHVAGTSSSDELDLDGGISTSTVAAKANAKSGGAAVAVATSKPAQAPASSSTAPSTAAQLPQPPSTKAAKPGAPAVVPLQPQTAPPAAKVIVKAGTAKLVASSSSSGDEALDFHPIPKANAAAAFLDEHHAAEKAGSTVKPHELVAQHVAGTSSSDELDLAVVNAKAKSSTGAAGGVVSSAPSTVAAQPPAAGGGASGGAAKPPPASGVRGPAVAAPPKATKAEAKGAPNKAKAQAGAIAAGAAGAVVKTTEQGDQEDEPTSDDLDFEKLEEEKKEEDAAKAKAKAKTGAAAPPAVVEQSSSSSGSSSGSSSTTGDEDEETSAPGAAAGAADTTSAAARQTLPDAATALDTVPATTPAPPSPSSGPLSSPKSSPPPAAPKAVGGKAAAIGAKNKPATAHKHHHHHHHHKKPGATSSSAVSGNKKSASAAPVGGGPVPKAKLVSAPVIKSQLVVVAPSTSGVQPAKQKQPPGASVKFSVPEIKQYSISPTSNSSSPQGGQGQGAQPAAQPKTTTPVQQQSILGQSTAAASGTTTKGVAAASGKTAAGEESASLQELSVVETTNAQLQAKASPPTAQGKASSAPPGVPLTSPRSLGGVKPSGRVTSAENESQNQAVELDQKIDLSSSSAEERKVEAEIKNQVVVKQQSTKLSSEQQYDESSSSPDELEDTSKKEDNKAAAAGVTSSSSAVKAGAGAAVASTTSAGAGTSSAALIVKPSGALPSSVIEPVGAASSASSSEIEPPAGSGTSAPKQTSTRPPQIYQPKPVISQSPGGGRGDKKPDVEQPLVTVSEARLAAARQAAKEEERRQWGRKIEQAIAQARKQCAILAMERHDEVKRGGVIALRALEVETHAVWKKKLKELRSYADSVVGLEDTNLFQGLKLDKQQQDALEQEIMERNKQKKLNAEKDAAKDASNSAQQAQTNQKSSSSSSKVDLEEAIEKEKQKSSSQLKELQTKFDAQQEYIQQVENIVEVLHNARQHDQDQYQEKVKELKDRLNEVTKLLAEARQQSKEKQTTIEKLENFLTEKQHLIEKLQDDLREVKTEKREMDERLEKFKKQLPKELDVTGSLFKKPEKEIEYISSKISNLQMELELAVKKDEKSKNLLKRLQDERETLFEKLQKQEDQNKQYKKILDERKEKHEKLADKYEAEYQKMKVRSEREVEKLTEERVRTEKQLLLQIDMLDREVKHLREWNDNLAKGMTVGARPKSPGMMNTSSSSSPVSVSRTTKAHYGKASDVGSRGASSSSAAARGPPDGVNVKAAKKDLSLINKKIDTLIDRIGAAVTSSSPDQSRSPARNSPARPPRTKRAGGVAEYGL